MYDNSLPVHCAAGFEFAPDADDVPCENPLKKNVLFLADICTCGEDTGADYRPHITVVCFFFCYETADRLDSCDLINWAC